MNNLNDETLENLMEPKHYGKLENPSGVGVGLDEKTKEYVIFYTILDGETVTDVSYATNGCQDTVVIGSMYSDMIINNDLHYANDAIQRITEKLGELTKEQKVCSDIVFTAFIASLKNYDNRQSGEDEELHVLKMKDSCEAISMEKEDE